MQGFEAQRSSIFFTRVWIFIKNSISDWVSYFSF